ncbi:hypothetical protein CF54_18260 [Streptomyces sp. Tu 6176]|nr:hypothetical protein CF54_18260 [Streptomyces sp. Tu 6176]
MAAALDCRAAMSTAPTAWRSRTVFGLPSAATWSIRAFWLPGRARLLRSLPSEAVSWSVPATTTTRSAALTAAWVAALSVIAPVPVVLLPAAS